MTLNQLTRTEYALDHYHEIEQAREQFTTKQYTGEAQGLSSTIKMGIRLKIESIDVLEEMETVGLGDLPLNTLPHEMVAANTIDVDGVTGATVTSNAMKQALRKAIDKAVEDLVGSVEAVSGASQAAEVDLDQFEFGPNQALGVGKGIHGPVVVRVTSSDGQTIDQVEVLDHHETPSIGTRAIDALPTAFVEANSTEVDGVSGATVTSNALKQAVQQALAGETPVIQDTDANSSASTPAEANLADYTTGPDQYLGKAKGIHGDIVVRVTSRDKRGIDLVEVLDHHETEGIGTRAIDALPNAFYSATNTEDVHAISGATVTSQALKDAVDQALSRAAGAPVDASSHASY